MFVSILAFIFILGLLIFVHEWGHYIGARLANIKVEEFAFGFPPRIFSWKRGETVYAINALPLGGYVRLLGEDGGSSDERSFGKQKARTRLAVIVAGVVMNLVLAVVALSIGFMVGMVPVVSDSADLGGVQQAQVMITGVSENSAAAGAELMSGDILTGFSSPEAVRTFTTERAGQSVDLTIERDGEVLIKSVTLGTDASAPLGVGLTQLTKVRLAPIPAIGAAVVETGKTVVATFDFLGDFFKKLFTTGEVAEGVSGPVGIFSVTSQAVTLGASYVLQLLAILSINLALLNILPFPALDGGRALFVALEGVVRRRVVRQEIEATIHAVGFVLLLVLVAIITYRDIISLR